MGMRMKMIIIEKGNAQEVKGRGSFRKLLMQRLNLLFIKLGILCGQNKELGIRRRKEVSKALDAPLIIGKMDGVGDVSMGKHDVLRVFPLKIIAQNHRAIDGVVGDIVSLFLVVLGIQKRMKVVAKTIQNHRGARKNPIEGMGARANLIGLKVIGGMTETTERDDVLDLGFHSGIVRFFEFRPFVPTPIVVMHKIDDVPIVNGCCHYE